MKTKPALRLLLVAALAAATVFGACQLAFLCDDAYITFRYVSNAHDGLGLVWNAPPFQPVEGYTGFLWALVLWATWSWFGVEPPDAANVLSVGFGLCLFAVTAAAAFRLRGRDGRRLADVVAFGTLAMVVGNRTFLQWMTGGLETALFNLGFVGWVVLAFLAPARRTAGWLAAWSTAAAVAALTRPDGLLLVAATTAVALAAVLRRQLRTAEAVRGIAPLAAVLTHVAWRRAVYGEWLPNTYYAKVVAPWPEAGLRYLACFALEHGAWLWLLVALTWLVVELRRGAAAAWRAVADHLSAAAAVAATILHAGYYVLLVGGDHFEYRVLSHLVPLGALSAAAMAARLRAGAALPLASILAIGIGSSIGWIHLVIAQTEPAPPYRPIAASLPAWAAPMARWYDRQQAWLQLQFVCHRCNQHAWSLHATKQLLPARTRMPVDAGDLPVVQARVVGLVGWVLPDCAIVDLLGLNDWVAARTPVKDWNAPFLPQDVLRAALARADQDANGRSTRDELLAAFAPVPGSTPATNAAFVDLVLLLFAREHADALTPADVAELLHFFAHLRFMAHEREAPPAYVTALDPNVTIENRAVVVRKRDVPLTAERVRAIEQEWRDKMRPGATPR